MPNYDLGTKRKKISPYLLIAAIAVLLVLIAYLLGRRQNIGQKAALRGQPGCHCVWRPCAVL